MQNKKSFLIGGALATLLLASATSVGAAPASITLSGIKQYAPSQADTVHWRRWHHCHWRWGWRRCHGYRYYGYPYGYRYYGAPGIVLGFGGFRHHHHWRHW
jgi:hypothetical protein